MLPVCLCARTSMGAKQADFLALQQYPQDTLVHVELADDAPGPFAPAVAALPRAP